MYQYGTTFTVSISSSIYSIRSIHHCSVQIGYEIFQHRMFQCTTTLLMGALGIHMMSRPGDDPDTIGTVRCHARRVGRRRQPVRYERGNRGGTYPTQFRRHMRREVHCSPCCARKNCGGEPIAIYRASRGRCACVRARRRRSRVYLGASTSDRFSAAVNLDHLHHNDATSEFKEDKSRYTGH